MIAPRSLLDVMPLARAGRDAFVADVGAWVLVGHVPGSATARTTARTARTSMFVMRGGGARMPVVLEPHFLAWSLPPRSVVVGRGVDCDVRLDHPSVSKLHARIHVRPDGIHVDDAGSSNGTCLNGDALPDDGEVHASSGDLLRFGGCVLQLFDADELLDLLAALQAPRATT